MKLRLLLLLCAVTFNSFSQNNVLVFQSDFGLKDGAVSAMKGVALGVSTDIKIFDLTHEIPAFNVWEAAYRLSQTAQYYPAGTVFVSVCDPGVGTSRHSVVLLTKSGHYFVTPDNGTLTLIAEQLGIQEIREIDEVKNRRKNSNESYTFHGRDVYAFTGARLASKSIAFEQVGPKLPNEVVKIAYQKPVFENGIIKGAISILDIQYGNVWTNIDKNTFSKLEVKSGDLIKVQIFNGTEKVFEEKLPLVNTFGQVAVGNEVCYFNSLLNFAVAVNQGNFSERHKVYSGADWSILISK
jgi:S-adenosylmethionine hydrolase